MLVKIRKTGNSLALTIPQEVATYVNLKEKDLVNVDPRDGGVFIAKVNVIPNLETQIEQIAEKGILRFRHDLDKLAKP